MPTLTCPQPDKLLAFMLGHVPEMEAAEIAEHLDECTTCDQTATSLESVSDTFIAGLKRPTGDASWVSEPEFRSASDLIAALGRDPSSIGLDRDAAALAGSIGQYQLLEKLGQGGMGAVYKALHQRLEKIVAIKILPPEQGRDAPMRARFDREMKAVGRLNHANIVRAMDAGEVDGMQYLVMEYVDGIDLSRLSREQGPLPIAEACEIIRQAALGLDAAHRRGMVHRDIKPSNVMLTYASDDEPPTVKVLDLGLALFSDVRQNGENDLTGTGQMMGTLDYMAPEQGGDSHDVDIRADIYSLGATLYRLLVGEPIYHGPNCQTQLQKMIALANAPAPEIRSRRGDVPETLASVVHRMIAKDPANRYETPSEVADALWAWASGASLARLLDNRSDAAGTGPAAAPERPTVSEVGSSRVFPPAISPTQRVRRATPGIPGGLYVALGGAAALALLAFALAAVYIFRTPQGTITVEVDERYRKDVALELTRQGESLRVSDELGWTMKLADGRYDIDVVGSDDRFLIDKDVVTVRRGDDVVVRVTVKPPVEVVAQPPPPTDLHEQAIAWIAANNSFGPDHQIVADTRGEIQRYAASGVGFSYRFSGPLLRSGKPSVLAVHGNKMFVHELAPDQARLMVLTNADIAVSRSGKTQLGGRAEQPEFVITSLDFENDHTLGSDGKVAARVGYQRLRRSDSPQEHYWVRITFHLHRAAAQYQGISGDLAAERGALLWDVDNPLPASETAAAVTAFVEIGMFDGSEEDIENFVALSDPVSQVITLHAAK